MRRVKLAGGIAATAAAALLATSSGAASADPGETTHVDDFTAVANGGSVVVNGQASFVDTPVLIGEDGTGDATISGPTDGALPLGDDLTGATISKPDPFKDSLTFTLDVANQPPELNGTPETVHYHWEISVDGEQQLRLQAIRSAQFASPGPDEIFRILRDGDSGFEVVAEVPGKMADGVVEWQVPMNEINAEPGSVITQDGIRTTLGASGIVYFVNLGGDEMFMDADDYVVPGPSAQLGIAPVGTPADLVPLSTDGTVETSGAFSGILPTPTEPGEYTVAVKVCNGPAGCDLTTTDLTVSPVTP